MELSEGSSESAIINIAINIFQNVGIRRWIEEIQILKNEQIYFEICKIIFPQTIIHLFRLGENQALTTGQKIQGVIDLIAKIINNDLYHISGEAIANGKTIHLKNFLQLLQALSNSMIAKDVVSQVESAPEKDQSFTYNDHNKSYYTVIGNYKQFGPNIIYTESSGDTEDPEREDIVAQPNQGARTSGGTSPNTSGTSQSGNTIKGPRYPHPDIEVNKEDGKKSRPPKNTPPFQSVPVSRQLPYPVPLHQKNREEFDRQNGKWIALVKGMNQTKINLEKERMMETREAFIRYKMEQDYQNRRVKNKIQRESNQRKKYINEKINNREHLIHSLKGEEQAQRAIVDLFRQQKKARKNNAMMMKKRANENLKKLGDFQELDQLLQQAAMSTKPDQYRRE